MEVKSFGVIAASLLGYVIAQTLKFIIALRKDGLTINDFFASGGVPSSHSSVMASMTVYIGMLEGFDSSIFGLSLVILGVVVYDSLGVRRSTGDNTLAINKIARKLSLKNIQKKSILGRGHNLHEVIAGLAIGSLTGYVLYQLVF